MLLRNCAKLIAVLKNCLVDVFVHLNTSTYRKELFIL